MSRTAKNQKDFKIEALHGWKRGKLHAMVVCPIYHLPTRTSQIYNQALTRNVCIFTYAHMAVLVRFSNIKGEEAAQKLLLRILTCAEAMNPGKDAAAYWTNLNRTMLETKAAPELWRKEKLATEEAIRLGKEEALTFLAREREAIMRMSKDEAIRQLIKNRKLDSREKMVRSAGDNGIMRMT